MVAEAGQSAAPRRLGVADRLPGRGRFWDLAAFWIPGLFLLLLLGLPLYWIIQLSLGYPRFGVAAFVQLMDSRVHLRVFGQTVEMAAVATLAALALGYPVAYVMARLPARWQAIALCVVLLPLWTNLLVRTYAWMIILAPNGPINQALLWLGAVGAPIDLSYNRFGTVVGLTHSVLPYLILPIYASCQKIDPQLGRAAAIMGARPLGIFLNVELPLSLPGVVAGCLFAFILGLGAFVIPALLGGPSERTVAMLIESTANQQLNWNLAAAIALELLLATLLLVVVQHRLIGLGSVFGGDVHYQGIGRTLRLAERIARPLRRLVPMPRGRTPTSVRSSAAFDRLMRIVTLAALLFLSLPLLIVVPVSFSSSQYLRFPPPGLSLRWYEQYLTGAGWISATGLSIVVGLLVVALSITVGTLAAVAVVRGTARHRGVLAAACLVPMILPNMITAVGVFFAFSQLRLVGTAFGLVLAHSLLALPLVFITVTAGLRGLEPTLERAASVLGARPLQAFLRVVLPLLKPSMLAGCLFAFIISFDEIVVSLFLTSVSMRTLPKMMWENIVMHVDPTISAVSTILILVSCAIVLVGQRLQRSGRSRAR